METNKGDWTGVSNNLVEKRGLDFRIIACDHLFSIQFLIFFFFAFYITLHTCTVKCITHYTTILNRAVSWKYKLRYNTPQQTSKRHNSRNVATVQKTCVWNMRKWNQTYGHLVILGKDWRINCYSFDIGPLRMHVILALSFPSKFIASCHACFSYHEPLTEARTIQAQCTFRIIIIIYFFNKEKYIWCLFDIFLKMACFWW